MCVFASDENGLRAGKVLPGPAALSHTDTQAAQQTQESSSQRWNYSKKEALKEPESQSALQHSGFISYCNDAWK